MIRDEDVSGGRAISNRGLEELIRRAENGLSAGVIVYKMDRFGRDAAEVVVAVKRLRDAGARLISADGYDSDSPMGAILLGALSGLAEYQLLAIRAGWARVTAGAVESGIHIAARAPVGYARADADGGQRNGRLVLDPDAAAVVRQAFEMRAGGASHGDVVAHLRRAGRPLVKSAVTAMLENRVYLGEARGPNGAVNPNAHDAIVDEDLFNRVHAVRGTRARPTGLAAQAMLGGVIRCASCGHKLRVMGSSNRAGEREASYVCAKHYSDGDCQAPAAARVKAVDDHIIGILANHWDEITASVQDAEQRFIEAREAVRNAEEALDAWVDDAELYVALGRDRHRRGVLARQSALDVARSALYDLDDPGLPDDGTVLWVDGTPYPYEVWGDDPERDRRVLRSVIAEVTLEKADPVRRRWQPIGERVNIRWVGGE